MNRRIREIAKARCLDEPPYFDLRVNFAMRCIERTQHLIVDPAALEFLSTGITYAGLTNPDSASRQRLDEAAESCRRLANSHRGNSGSESLDGSGHAAVSATFGLSSALAGDAWHAAEYAAYALVYSYASYAVTQPEAFTTEYDWQVSLLDQLLVERSGDTPVTR